MLQHKMNDREEEMSEDFREEKQEEEKDRMDISPLSVTRQQFDNLTLHSTFSVQQRKRSKIRTSRFSPTQIVKFQNLTLDSPNSEQRQPLTEANKYGFKTPKGKRHLSPGLNTKREVSSDPQRHGGCKRSRTNPSMSWHFGHPEESSVKSQVREIPENLEAECPFFMKSMIRSNISVCFMLTLPRRFCNLHLPLHGTATITLEDKEGKEYETKFLADKRTLSGGWKGFCQAKDLRLDDVLVFQLVSPLKFKVYRVRPEYDPSEDDVDAAFVLLKMSTSDQTLGKPSNAEENPANLTSYSFVDDDESEDQITEIRNLAPITVVDLIRPGQAADFEDVRIYENFAST